MKKIILIIISFVITLIPLNSHIEDNDLYNIPNIESNEIMCNDKNEENEEQKNINVVDKSNESNIVDEEKNDVIAKENKKEITKIEQVKEDVNSYVKDEEIANYNLKQEESIVIVEDKALQEEIKTEEIVNQFPKKNGYYYNEQESNRLVSEFRRITNNNINFTVRIDKEAKNSNPFFPYREDQIEMQVYGASFGYFIVYAEDFYKDDIKQRTLYYITFDV